MSIKLAFKILIIIFLANYCYGQNLVVNGAFDIQSKIPVDSNSYGYDQFGVPKGWSTPFRIKPFFYTEGNDHGVEITLAAPAEDDVIFHKYDYLGYVQGTLKVPLKKGELYYFLAKIKNVKTYRQGKDHRFIGHPRGDTSHVFGLTASNGLGIKLLDKEAEPNRATKYQSALRNSEHSFYCDKILEDSAWVWVIGSFRPKIVATHFLLGNFISKEKEQYSLQDGDRRKFKIRSKDISIREERRAEYLISEVQITQKKPDILNPSCQCEMLENEHDVKEVFARTLYFAEGSTQLTSSASQQLDSCLMRIDSSYRVEVIGYANSVGHKVYNDQLSENRAQVVVDYLLQKGSVPNKNITNYFMGEDLALNLNGTNKRSVEVFFYPHRKRSDLNSNSTLYTVPTVKMSDEELVQRGLFDTVMRKFRTNALSG